MSAQRHWPGRGRTCRGKRRHRAQKGAMDEMHELKRDGARFAMTVYRCRVCLHWHVGPMAPPVRRGGTAAETGGQHGA